MDMDMEALGKALMIVAAAVAVLGLALWLGSRLGLGSLPGDIRIQRESWGCYIPIATSVLVSIVLTILLNLLLRRR